MEFISDGSTKPITTVYNWQVRLTLLCNGMASHCISTLKISTSNDVSLMSIYGAGVEDATTTSSRLMNETANEINFFTFPSLTSKNTSTDILVQ